MSKKYVLTEEYPNSPKKGLEIFKNGAYWQSDFCTEGIEYFRSRATEFNPKDFPKNWEPIVEAVKLYEILSFKGLLTGMIYHLTGNKSYIPHSGVGSSLESALAPNSDLIIYSVKRLPDGEIFTIGDKISYSYNYPETGIITKDYTIEKIYFIEEDRLAFYVGGGLNLGIQKLLKLKQPLFTTKDGVDIYEGNMYWYITMAGALTSNRATAINKKPYGYSTREAAIKSIPLFKTEDGVDIYEEDEYYYTVKNNNVTQLLVKDFKKWFLEEYPDNKRFATREATEEYILINKPSLSINDIRKVIETEGMLDEYTLLKIVESRQSKLNE